jgi:hypothetical protein
MTESERWERLTAVAKAWTAFDHIPNVDSSEEREEDDFIDDASVDTSEAV